MTEPHYHVAFEIARERSNQITRNEWTSQHDDYHEQGEMAVAAACYAHAASTFGDQSSAEQTDPVTADNNPPPRDWPWLPIWWRPHNRRTALIKAAALCIAEIERLDRLSGRKPGNQPAASAPAP